MGSAGRRTHGVEKGLDLNILHYSELDYLTFETAMIYKDLMENFDFGQFWSGENVGISSKESDIKSETALEIRADEHQAKTAMYHEQEKCWYVELPWIDPSPEGRMLTDNTKRVIAMWHKVHSTVRPEHMNMVNDAYNEILESGFAEVVPEEQVARTDHPTYVLTSRPVIRPDKVTTKCRIVANASLPDPKNKKRTLNSLLMPGKNLLPQIMVLILKSKQKRYIASIDIKKMFFSVKLKKESDKDMFRYMWAPPGAERPTMYRFTRLIFGGVCSPYMAIWCLKETAKMFSDKYPEAVKIILEQSYMDDIVVTADTISELITLVNEILRILDHGGFYGHKITANHPEALQSIDQARIDHSPEVSLLGLLLNHSTNEFRFDLDSKYEKFDPLAENITRRHVVSLGSQVFDTQGYVSPYVMLYKRILPKLWHNKTAWDENLLAKTIKDINGAIIPDPVALEAVQLFQNWIAEIPRLKELRFPRWLGGPIEFIAVFGDASKTGMGVVAYAVCTQQDGTRQSQLIFSKSSLMPKNLRPGAEAEDALTIARAELVALLMGLNLGLYLQSAYTNLVTPLNTVYFTDSLLNLQRVQRGLGHCNVWEERRLTKILASLHESTVRFCPGVLNPADLPSRGCTLEELIDRFEFWTKGPEFLLKPSSQWPLQPVPSSQPDLALAAKNEMESDKDLKIYWAQVMAINEEQVQQSKQAANLEKERKRQNEPKHFLDSLVENCSSWWKAVKVLIRIKRLAAKMRETSQQRASRSRNPAFAMMKAEEIQWAEFILFKRAQEVEFRQEIEVLKKGPVGKTYKLPNNSPLRNLPVIWDEQDQCVRLEARLHLSSSLPHFATVPMVIPKCRAAELKILHLHHSRMHISQKHTFALLREQYWVSGSFAYVKSVVRKCLTPRCRYVRFNSPKMSPLPTARIDNPRSWAHVGVDYMGPLNCKHDCFPEMLAKVRADSKLKNLPTKALKLKALELVKKCIHPKTHKVWLVLFTCFHTRAIHVELVHSCSTQEFLNAFRKFVGHCGHPLMFYSDNARYFTAADRHIKELLKNVSFDKLQNETYNGDGAISWQFSTPEAPWTNGVTERMVGVFKRQFRVAVQKECLSASEIETLLVELKSIINDRPLGVTNQDPSDLSVITPNLLIYGRPMHGFATPEPSKLKELSFSDMWLKRKRVLNTFFKAWQREYLYQLSIPQKWLTDDQSSVSPGDVVLVKPDTLEKNAWILGRIESLHEDPTGVVKSAFIRLPGGSVLKRSMRSVALLEPDYQTKEKDDLKQTPGVGHAGSVAQTLKVPPQGGLLGAECRSPGPHRPCQSLVAVADQDLPEEAATMTAESVSQTASLSNATVDATAAAVTRGERKKRRKRKGFYSDLAKGRIPKD
jgi:hypothetical protein